MVMKIYNNANLNRKHLNGVIAIGNFDGLHLGHQKVINEARQKAKKFKLPLGVMTFEPVPVMFFSKKNNDHRINSLQQNNSSFLIFVITSDLVELIKAAFHKFSAFMLKIFAISFVARTSPSASWAS